MEEDEVISQTNDRTSETAKNVQETVVAPSPFDWKPNTTYLMCSTMKHILPPSHISQQFDPGNPQNLTFFILPSEKGKDKEGIFCLRTKTCF